MWTKTPALWRNLGRCQRVQKHDVARVVPAEAFWVVPETDLKGISKRQISATVRLDSGPKKTMQELATQDRLKQPACSQLSPGVE